MVLTMIVTGMTEVRRPALQICDVMLFPCSDRIHECTPLAAGVLLDRDGPAVPNHLSCWQQTNSQRRPNHLSLWHRD